MRVDFGLRVQNDQVLHLGRGELSMVIDWVKAVWERGPSASRPHVAVGPLVTELDATIK